MNPAFADSRCGVRRSALRLISAGSFLALALAGHALAQEGKLEQQWKKLSAKESNEVTRRHLHGLVRAMHLYYDRHGSLPPAVVPNPELPAGKRLSGLVLLLPYLGAESGIDKGKFCFDEQIVKAGKALYESIDLSKAWDDPVNLKAARTIVPAFLAPGNGSFRDTEGYAVSHFAFVRGSSKGLDGAFPGENGVRIDEIIDGTVVTFAMGQINHDLGPWIAEGLSTARQLYPPTDAKPGTFSSRYKSGCYFAFCDSSAVFVKLDGTSPRTLDASATRSGGDGLILIEEPLKRVSNPEE